MPDPDPPPQGCPECVKVILNGGTAARVLDETCAEIYRYVEENGTIPNVKELVKSANEIEDLVFKFQRQFLESIGFKGPWSHALNKGGK